MSNVLVVNKSCLLTAVGLPYGNYSCKDNNNADDDDTFVDGDSDVGDVYRCNSDSGGISYIANSCMTNFHYVLINSLSQEDTHTLIKFLQNNHHHYTRALDIYGRFVRDSNRQRCGNADSGNSKFRA
uniref:Uncharacterized protein n=1 Tax=Glossina austeni TaxID=7395 RepID=A0A1A9VY85_GLOAU